MRITFGRVLIALALIAGIAALVWSLLPQPVPVELATVERGRFVATVDEDGKTRIRERYVVSAPLTGRSTRVRLKPGDGVAGGDAVTTIMPSPPPFLDPRSRREAEERLGAAQAARERSRVLIERARAEHAQAKNEHDRTKTLVERGASTAQALERTELALRVAERDLRAAEFQHRAAEHELARAKVLLARYSDAGEDAPADSWTVEAPIAGVILKVPQESETTVTAGMPLIEIGDPRDLEIVVEVLSSDAVEIKPGAEVIIEGWGGPGVLKGRVRRVEPAAFTKISTLGVEEQRVNVLIDITSPPKQWAGLGDAYRVDARIVVFSQDDALIVPSGALFRQGDAWHVYQVLDGRAELRKVDVMRRSGRLAAIRSGLKAGDKVIVYPSDRISNGVRVKPR